MALLPLLVDELLWLLPLAIGVAVVDAVSVEAVVQLVLFTVVVVLKSPPIKTARKQKTVPPTDKVMG